MRMPTRRLILSVIAGAALSAACGCRDDSAAVSPPPPPRRVALFPLTSEHPGRLSFRFEAQAPVHLVVVKDGVREVDRRALSASEVHLFIDKGIFWTIDGERMGFSVDPPIGNVRDRIKDYEFRFENEDRVILLRAGKAWCHLEFAATPT